MISSKGTGPLVERVKRIPMDDKPHRLKVRYADGARANGNWSGVWRKLRAVLPGIELVQTSVDHKGKLLKPNESIIEKGTYNGRFDWHSLNAYYINLLARCLPDQPVVYVDLGDRQCQVLVVLAYRPDDEEIAMMTRHLNGVVTVTRAEPCGGYDGYALSLLTPRRATPKRVKKLRRELEALLRFA